MAENGRERETGNLQAAICASHGSPTSTLFAPMQGPGCQLQRRLLGRQAGAPGGWPAVVCAGVQLHGGHGLAAVSLPRHKGSRQGGLGRWVGVKMGGESETGGVHCVYIKVAEEGRHRRGCMQAVRDRPASIALHFYG